MYEEETPFSNEQMNAFQEEADNFSLDAKEQWLWFTTEELTELQTSAFDLLNPEEKPSATDTSKSPLKVVAKWWEILETEATSKAKKSSAEQVSQTIKTTKKD